jgi:hypothetical protein
MRVWVGWTETITNSGSFHMPDDYDAKADADNGYKLLLETICESDDDHFDSVDERDITSVVTTSREG